MNGEKLIARYLSGNAEAGDQLVEIMSPPIWRVAWRYAGGNEADAQDIFHETFVKLLDRDAALLKRYDASRLPLEKYAAMIARSCALDFLRKRNRERRDAVMDSNTIQESGGGVEAWELELALNFLEDDEQRIIRAFYLQSLSAEEIAASLDMHAATVRRKKAQALEKMRKILEEK
jgi:RNA polymerase sigma-70 factor (ECF subfamily)